MEIVKKNLFSIICGVVAIAALVAVFLWPLDGYFDTLKSKAEDRAKVQTKIVGLLGKQRNLPVFDPNNPTASKLTKFPSRTIIALGTKAQQGVAASSEKVVTDSLKLNEQGHELVLNGSLPSPIT